MSRRDWPQQVRKPVQLANFRPSPSERYQARKGVFVPPGWRIAKYLELIRKVPCCTCPENRAMHAHHIRFGEASKMAGLSRKPPDWFAVPLCWRCHHSLHNHREGEEAWWLASSFDPYAFRKELFALWLRHKQDPDTCLELMRERRDGFMRGAIREMARKRRLTIAEAIEQVEAGLGRRS